MQNPATTPVDATKVKQWTARYPVISHVLQFVLHAWPSAVEDNTLKPYFTRKNELSVHAGCLLWSSRIIIPPQGREEVINVLHETHSGINRMKGLAWSYVWWPKMDVALEERVKSCEVCQAHQKTPAPVPLHPWEWRSRPWSRVHIDYAGPFMGKMFLLIINAHFKWLDVYCVNSATTKITIEKLRATFTTHGLPEMIVSGSSFTSGKFKVFMQRNGIRHVNFTPYHPSSNDLVERMVQTFKKQDRRNIETKLIRFLLNYRITPQTTTGESLAQLRWAAAWGHIWICLLEQKLAWHKPGRRFNTISTACGRWHSSSA